MILLGRVVEHDVEPHLHVVVVSGRDQIAQFGVGIVAVRVLLVHRAEHERHVAPVVALVGIELVDRQQLDHRHAQCCQPRQLGDEAGERARLGGGATFRCPAHVNLRDDQWPSGPAAGPNGWPRLRHGEWRDVVVRTPAGSCRVTVMVRSEVDGRRPWIDECALPAVDDQPVSGAIGDVADPGPADGHEQPTLRARDHEADLACVGRLDSDPHHPIVPGSRPTPNVS